MAETQPTDWVLPPAPTPLPCQQQEAAAGIFLWWWFLVFFSFFKNDLLLHLNFLSHQQWSSYGSRHNSAHILRFASRPTPLPCQQQEAAEGIFSWWVLVSFSFFMNDLLLHLIFLSRQQWFSHENGRNSAHSLSFASHLTPPPCQQQEAAAGIFCCGEF